MTRLLVIMGSGETSPTMIKVHRSLFARLGESETAAVPAVLLDTPVGFQENAEIVAAKAVEYFRESVGREVEVATWRRGPAADDPLGYVTMLTRLRAARYVFAGPGSPSYALAQSCCTTWRPALPEAQVMPRPPARSSPKERSESAISIWFARLAAAAWGWCTKPCSCR